MNENKWLQYSFWCSLLAFAISFIFIPGFIALIKQLTEKFIPIPEEVSVFLMTVPHSLAMLFMILIITVSIEQERHVTEKLHLTNWHLFYVLEGCGLEFVLFPMLAIIVFAFSLFLSKVGIEVKRPALLSILLTCKYTSFLIIAFAAVCIAPLVEEIIFRRIMYEYLKIHFGKYCSFIVTSLVFAAIHITLIQLPALFILGIVLQILYIYHRSLYPSIIFHSIHNLTAMILVFIIKITGFSVESFT